LSLLPPATLPLTAFSGPSELAHAAEPVAGLFSARLVSAAVAAGGTVSKDVASTPNDTIARVVFI
jgi:hypothetical protein